MRIDRETVERFKAGDDEAFVSIFRTCAPALFGTVVRILADRALAEDVVQETFVRLYRIRTRLEPDKPVHGLLARMAANLAIDTLRKRKRERWEPLDSDPGAEMQVSPVDETRGTQESINRAAATLAPIYRTVLALRYGQEMAYEEIASVLNISVSAVALRLKRGKEQLRRALTENRGQ